MNKEVKNITTQEQAVKTQSEVISIAVKSEVDRMLLKTAQLIIDSDLTEGQKMLRIYDIFEASLQEYHGAQTTLERFNDDCNVDDKKMSADMTQPQSERNQNLRTYIDTMRKIIEPIGDYLYQKMMVDEKSWNYQNELNQHYRELNVWSADIRSNIIRKKQIKMRGFKFKNKKKEPDTP